MIGLAELPISTLLTPASARAGQASRWQSASRKSDSNGYHQMGVRELFEGLEVTKKRLRKDTTVTCLITDSRRVVPGAVFFAIGGLRTDGNHFIEEAVDRGALAVVTEQDLGPHFPIDFFQVSDVRQVLAVVARRFYEAPDTKLEIAGVTGTNGKTTVSMLTQHLIGGSDRIGLMGTVRYDLGRRTLPSFRTTPESVDVYALLSQMLVNDCKKAVMEISSHGIDQKRTYGLAVDVAAFLNLTQDHIDYHKSMEAYYQVKRQLFTGETGHRPSQAVINIDCPYGRRLIEEVDSRLPVTTFGLDHEAAFRARDVELSAAGTRFTLLWPEGQAEIQSPLLGRYNVSNLLAALAIAYVQGCPVEALIERIATFPGVPGRMERIEEGQDFNVLVDYAHTDDALRHACGMLREITAGRLIVLFGCGGDRDRTKRAPMLRAVLEGADEVIVTADNPRTEALEQIFADMREVGTADAVTYLEDRKDAISHALDLAKPGDCVLIAGKGHEAYQEFGGTVIPFDDRMVARELLRLKQT
ncbi:MAG: UDP-N-acetylmuramoyl-L-alanyl-D-glutamate--2,6-diaminopimelate ligase [Opitutales bacterium]